MKPVLLLLIAAALLPAQAPPSFTPETVVAKIDGKDVTLGEIQQMLQGYPPIFMQTFQRDPVQALQQAFIVKYTAAEGDKLKLGETDPWKEQIEVQRMNVVSSAMFFHERNTYQVSVDDVDAFYKRNQARYEEAKIKVIKIAFKPGLTGNLSVEEMAKRAVESAHAASDRSETEARTLANGLVKQLRDNNADFAQFVQLYSDDPDSKADGGNFGTVRPNSPYADDFKKAVFKLKPGEVSDAIAAGPAFYIVRLESTSVQPLSKVREQIMDEIKEAHLAEYLGKLRERFKPQIQRPDVLSQLNGALGAKK